MMYALIPCCLLLAGGFLTAERRNQPRLALLLKGLASLCFVALGLLCGGWGLVSAGLGLGCIADVVLGLRKLFKSRRTLFFLAGSVVFLCGHLAYLAAVWPMGGKLLLCVPLGVVMGAALLKWLYARIEAGKALKDSVVYSVHGANHPNATGLAVFYPLEVQDKEELHRLEGYLLRLGSMYALA